MLSEVYHRSLRAFVAKRWLAPIIMVVSVAIILGIGALIPSELAPMEDKSRLVINATAPEGTSYEVMVYYFANARRLSCLRSPRRRCRVSR